MSSYELVKQPARAARRIELCKAMYCHSIIYWYVYMHYMSAYVSLCQSMSIGRDRSVVASRRRRLARDLLVKLALERHARRVQRAGARLLPLPVLLHAALAEELGVLEVLDGLAPQLDADGRLRARKLCGCTYSVVTSVYKVCVR